ncbi:MAG TPA: hypothetical protein VMR41_06315 [Patescibacteria group bacterium]|nr:hypothetical protein [Patescibacteria group bacterium]
MQSLGTLVEKMPHAFQSAEGSANIYYGQIRSGKTYGATADIFDELERGNLVYATWPIKIDPFDDRLSFWVSLRNLIFNRKTYFFIDSPKNLHYINADTGEVDGINVFGKMVGKDKNGKPIYEASSNDYISYLNKLNHCSLYIDEAWRVIDSYRGTTISNDVRNLILVTGHKFRTVNLITQRTTAIHVVARGNMGRFYKFVKVATWPWVRFERREFQEMSGENVDETVDPVSVKRYWLNKRIAEAYNTHYYGELSPLHDIVHHVYELSFNERLKVFWGTIRAAFRHKGRKSRPEKEK